MRVAVRGAAGARRRGAREPQRLERPPIGSSKPGSASSTDAPRQPSTSTRAHDRRPPRGRRSRSRESGCTRPADPPYRLASAARAGAAPGGSAHASRGSGSDTTSNSKRRVGDRPGHRSDVRQCAERARRVQRDPAVRRLEREDAAERRRDAHRAAAVGAQRERRHPERHGGRAPAARAAGGPRGVPRVAGDPGERRVRDALPAQLRRRGLADEHARRARAPGPPTARRRPRGAGVDGERAAQCRPAAGEQQVLDRRPARRPAPRRLPARASGSSEAGADRERVAASTRQNALTRGSSRSIRSNTAEVASTGDSVRAR